MGVAINQRENCWRSLSGFSTDTAVVTRALSIHILMRLVSLRQSLLGGGEVPGRSQRESLYWQVPFKTLTVYKERLGSYSTCPSTNAFLESEQIFLGVSIILCTVFKFTKGSGSFEWNHISVDFNACIKNCDEKHLLKIFFQYPVLGDFKIKIWRLFPKMTSAPSCWEGSLLFSGGAYNVL